MQSCWSGIKVWRWEWLVYRIKGRGQRWAECIHSAAVCGHCIVCRDGEEFAEVRIAWWFFPLGSGVCVHYSNASEDQSASCVLTSISQSTYRASSFLLQMTSEQPYTLTANISLLLLLFVHQHVFPSIVLHVLKPETRGHLCLSIMCPFLPSRHAGAALNLPSLNDWSGWEVTVYMGEEDNAGFSCDGACFFTLYE